MTAYRNQMSQNELAEYRLPEPEPELMASLTTEGITVSAHPLYLPDQSEPEAGHYMWAYYIRIENNSTRTVRLSRRKWLISGADGFSKQVTGDGVIGQNPVLSPGDSFEYTSGTPLNTSSGMMVGVFEMSDEAGAAFDVAVPAFSLDSPFDCRVVH